MLCRALARARPRAMRHGHEKCCPILQTKSENLPIVSDIMGRTFQRPFPSVERQMIAFGERLRLARLRRKITTVQMAERMDISRDTLGRLEKGDANIALGTYLRALRVLGLDRDLDLVAKDDELGRKLQDLELEPSSSGSRARSRSSLKTRHGDS